MTKTARTCTSSSSTVMATKGASPRRRWRSRSSTGSATTAAPAPPSSPPARQSAALRRARSTNRPPTRNVLGRTRTAWFRRSALPLPAQTQQRARARSLRPVTSYATALSRSAPDVRVQRSAVSTKFSTGASPAPSNHPELRVPGRHSFRPLFLRCADTYASPLAVRPPRVPLRKRAAWLSAFSEVVCGMPRLSGSGVVLETQTDFDGEPAA